jgi:hypothetical protein
VGFGGIAGGVIPKPGPEIELPMIDPVPLAGPEGMPAPAPTEPGAAEGARAAPGTAPAARLPPVPAAPTAAGRPPAAAARAPAGIAPGAPWAPGFMPSAAAGLIRALKTKSVTLSRTVSSIAVNSCEPSRLYWILGSCWLNALNPIASRSWSIA